MLFRLSKFDQSFSKIYVRNVTKSENKLFDCFEFIGVNKIFMPITLEVLNAEITWSPLYDEDGEKLNEVRYSFSSKYENFIDAISIKRGRAKDFPEVESIEVYEWVNFEPKLAIL